MKLRQASPRKEWRDYTEDHAELREYLHELIEDIDNDRERDPIALVGPYRTGKTQLLYEVFTQAWENGVPALYTSANQIIQEFEEDETATDIAAWLTERVADQARRASEGNSIDWLPNWNDSQDREGFLSELPNQEIDSDAEVLLLVDEVEQAYTTLRKGEFVDDRNPLRILLDDTEGIQQIWAFGLVAAYELGEADYARFDERRLPILEVTDVREALEERGKDPILANGIWWLSRGRIGWTNKLIDEVPSRRADLASWIRQISEEEFEGVNPINKETWTEGVTESDWDNARRSIMFLEGEYPPWELSRENGDSIPAETVASLSLEIFDDLFPDVLTPSAKQILERNLTRLCTSLAVTHANGKGYLPQNLLNNLMEIEGFIDLLGDLIVSFEGGSDARANATKCIQLLEPEDFRSEWNDKFYREVESGIGAWTLRPSMVSEAFPAIAVDPTQLTDASREEIESELERGIEVNPGVPTEHIEYEVRYCPSEHLLLAELERAMQPEALNKTFVLITNLEQEEIDLESQHERLLDLNRVYLHTHTATRLWDFVVHLQEYLRSSSSSDPINQRQINRAVDEEENRETRNTLTTLYEQLQNISETQVQHAVSQFEEHYSRRESKQPLWGEDLSGEKGDDNTPPAVYGSGGISLHSFAYTLACSRYDIDSFTDLAEVRSTILAGIDAEGDADQKYIESRAFGYTQFVRSTLNNTGVAEPLRRFSRRYQDQNGIRDPSIGNFQELMLELSSTDSEEELLEDLKDPTAEVHDIPAISRTNFNHPLADRFAWGILLEAVAVRNDSTISSIASECLNQLADLNERLAKAEDEVRSKNDQLQPPGDYGNNVTIRSDTITSRSHHLDKFSNPLQELQSLSESQDFGGIGIVYGEIISTYLSQFESQVSDLEFALYGSQLMEVDNLKAVFNRVETELNQSGRIFDELDHTQESAVEELETEADDIFNFQGAVGTSRLAPTNSEAFEKLNHSAGERADRLEEVYKKIQRLKKELDTRKEKQEEVQKQFSSLSEKVSR